MTQARTFLSLTYALTSIIAIGLSVPVSAATAGASGGQEIASDTAVAQEWETFKRRFLRPDGRIVDTNNGGVSHTEGQGFGMLFAVASADRPTFEQIWTWTDAHLRWEGTWLHAWKFQPDGAAPVPDPNNATDGDLLIAWALERASDQWHEPLYREAARRIARDVRRLLVSEVGGRTILLPGFEGFERDDSVVVNLSYYVFPAIEALISIDPAPVWDRLRRDGLELIEDARFGHWGLSPDWLQIAESGEIVPAADKPARFGYDAIRIPLYLVWAGLGTAERLRVYRGYWDEQNRSQRLPGWASLNNETVAPYDAANGFKAVRWLVEGAADGPSGRPPPRIVDSDDYYSASLVLLTRIAAADLLFSSSNR